MPSPKALKLGWKVKTTVGPGVVNAGGRQYSKENILDDVLRLIGRNNGLITKNYYLQHGSYDEQGWTIRFGTFKSLKFKASVEVTKYVLKGEYLTLLVRYGISKRVAQKIVHDRNPQYADKLIDFYRKKKCK